MTRNASKLQPILGQRADLSGRSHRHGGFQEGFHGPGRHEKGLYAIGRPPAELGHRVAHQSHYADRWPRRPRTSLSGTSFIQTIKCLTLDGFINNEYQL